MYATEEKKGTDPVAQAVQWMKTRSEKEKLALGVLAGVAVQGGLGLLGASRTAFLGTAIALRSLTSSEWDAWLTNSFPRKPASVQLPLRLSGLAALWSMPLGISLQTQDLTMLFLAIRLYCSFVMEYDIHTVLDALTLMATVWVVYTMRMKLHHTYQSDLDNVYSYYVAVPCLVLAVFVHPGTSHLFINRIMWGACVYLEAVSVLPQLMLMRKNKVVERFVGHYVFALGLSRFFSCAHWILQIIDGNTFLLHILGYGVWPVFVLLSEIIQTFILADYCYYYVKSYAGGSGVVRLPEYVV